MRSLLLVTSVLAVTGCAADRDDLDPIEPGSIARENAKRGSVQCSADESGNLRVRAPADARVTTNASEDANVEVDYATADPSAYQMPRPERPRSRSLGFIGDAPLTQGPNRGGRYSYGEHDNLIPPHHHSASSGWWQGPAFGGRGYYGYGRRW